MNTKNIKFFIYFPLLLGLVFSLLSYRFTSPNEFTDTQIWSSIYFFAYSFFYYSFLNLLLASPFALIFLRYRRVGKVFAYIVLSVFLIFFVADSFAYQQFRLHLNIAMLQMTLLGGGQVVSFSASMIFQIVLLMGACFLASLFCLWLANLLSGEQSRLKPSYLLIFIALGLAVCQGVYGFGFAYHNPYTAKVEENLPLSRPLHFNKLLIKTGLVSREDVYTFKKTDVKGAMNYPLSKLDCSGGEGYNIVFFGC